MLEETGRFVAEYLANLGFDIGIHRFEKRIDERKLKSELRTYIGKQKQYNELCHLADEIDYQGLVDFFDQNMIDMVCERLFDPNLNP